jgi:hypothetical protein
MPSATARSTVYKRPGRASLSEASRVLFQGLYELGPTRATFKVSHAGGALRAKGRTGCNRPERPENGEALLRRGPNAVLYAERVDVWQF